MLEFDTPTAAFMAGAAATGAAFLWVAQRLVLPVLHARAPPAADAQLVQSIRDMTAAINSLRADLKEASRETHERLETIRLELRGR